MPAKTACVVGAGPSGVAALKECLRQGFKPTCYELDTDVGGVWHRKDHSETNTPATWETLVTNTSKFNNCFSDFPPDANDPVYLTQERMFKYLRRATEHFGLEKYIHFKTRVIQIRKTKDHARTGKWEVFTAERGSEEAGNDLPGPRARDDTTLSRCHMEVFDFVLVCTGHFKVASYPDIPGTDTFPGAVSHSFNYASSKPFTGQNVLVVGNKLSAVDIASDLADSAKQVYMALGKGTWILPRCYPRNTPYDFLLSRSLMHSRGAFKTLNAIMMSEAQRNFDHDQTGIRPSKPPLYAGIGLSDDLPMKLMSGKVQAYGRLARLEKDRAHFQDGKVISGINCVVFCTGFKPDFSFVDIDVIEASGRMELYKMMFPLKEEHHSLVFIGNVGGDNACFCLYETQARLATRVFAGKHVLPSRDKMKRDIDFWYAQSFERIGNYDTVFISIFLFLDTVAQELGCYPSFWKVFWRNPRLAFRNWYGPILSAQFRLVGPDSDWEAAEKTCTSLLEEGSSALKHKDLVDMQHTDVCQQFVSRSVGIAIFSCATTLALFLVAKFGNENIFHRIGSRFT